MTDKFANLASFDQTLRDFFPKPGERIKQYVVDMRRESAWERETCPRFLIGAHQDNTDAVCRNAGDVAWTDLAHDCCDTCCTEHEHHGHEPQVVAWLEQKAARSPVCADKSQLSDEVAPELPSFRLSPVFATLPKRQPVEWREPIVTRWKP